MLVGNKLKEYLREKDFQLCFEDTGRKVWMMNENFSFCMAAEGAAGKHLTSSGHPADLKPGNSGSPFAKKRVKRLWLKWRSPESPPTQDKCVTASLIPRGSSQVWQQSQNIGWINRSGQAELPAEDEETSPLFYLCQ